MLAVMRLLAPPLAIAGGSVRFDGRGPDRRCPSARCGGCAATGLAMVYQDPMTSLNPLMRIGDQVDRGDDRARRGQGRGRSRSLELLARVELPDPHAAARAYPHELSGGMRQRAVIAMALAMSPAAAHRGRADDRARRDHPAPDPAVVNQLRRDLDMATIWVTHDLGVVAQLVERVVVMYAGYVVEEAPVDQLFHAPQHPYTSRLLAALPDPTRRPPTAAGPDPRPPAGGHGAHRGLPVPAALRRRRATSVPTRPAAGGRGWRAGSPAGSHPAEWTAA